jgi:hypothetical protein
MTTNSLKTGVEPTTEKWCVSYIPEPVDTVQHSAPVKNYTFMKPTTLQIKTTIT